MGGSNSRRGLLTTFGVALGTALSGCSEQLLEDRETTRTTSSEGATQKTTGGTPAGRKAIGKRLGFGEWHADGHWRFTVTELTLSTTVRTDAGDTYELPSDEQLLIVTTRVANDGSSTDEYFAGRFSALVGDETFSEQYRIENSDADWRIRTDQLRQVKYPGQWTAEGLAVEAGETTTAWSVFVVPRSAGRDDVTVGYNPDSEPDGPFPVGWVPDAGE